MRFFSWLVTFLSVAALAVWLSVKIGERNREKPPSILRDGAVKYFETKEWLKQLDARKAESAKYKLELESARAEAGKYRAELESARDEITRLKRSACAGSSTGQNSDSH